MRLLITLTSLAVLAGVAPAAQAPAGRFDALVAFAEGKMREHRVPGVRADLLFKLKRFDEAQKEFERAASLTNNTGQKKLLLEKAAECN